MSLGKRKAARQSVTMDFSERFVPRYSFYRVYALSTRLVSAQPEYNSRAVFETMRPRVGRLDSRRVNQQRVAFFW